MITIFFCIYALIGWIYEVSWFLLVKNTFVNRGVLFGLFLPIYGFGILILLLILKRFMAKKHYSSNLFYTGLSSSIIITFITVTIIEYTTPKIYNVNYFLQTYGLIVFTANLIGIISAIIIVKKFKINKLDATPVIVFLLIWIITTLVEYVAHYYIDTYSHKMLWDYSEDFLNINKRVNWNASRNFAIGGTLLLYTVQPLVEKYLKNVNLILN